MTNTETLSPADRLAKADKVRALRAKTVANGATADEAASAALMADRLQLKYGLTDDEVAPRPTNRRAASSDPFTNLWEDMVRESRIRQAREAMFNATGRWDADWGPRPDNGRSTRAPRQPRRPGTASAAGDCNCSDCRANRARQEAPKNEAPKNAGPRGKNTSHKYCDHEATSAARARCRKESRGY